MELTSPHFAWTTSLVAMDHFGGLGGTWETVRRHPASPTALCDPLISGEFLCPLLLEVFVILCHQAKFTSDGTLTSFNVIGFLSNHPVHLQYGFIIVII